MVSTAQSVCASFMLIRHRVDDCFKAWGSRHAPLFESGRMSYRARDFLEPWKSLVLPKSTGASSTPAVFLVRLILHDWQDREARK